MRVMVARSAQPAISCESVGLGPGLGNQGKAGDSTVSRQRFGSTAQRCYRRSGSSLLCLMHRFCDEIDRGEQSHTMPTPPPGENDA
jgi:hypothetical protein